MNALNGAVLRLLDANANRAREGLRVVEDYARFVLNDEKLSGRVKQVRHDLAGVLRGYLGEAILWRDTPGDVGVDNKTDSEMRRADVADVVTAAGKRVGEALRAIEEFLKTISPPPLDAAAVEGIRYRFYDVELAVARTLRPAGRFEGVRLYVLITESVCRRPWLETAKLAIGGGADCLQLREKELDGGELLARARQLVEICRLHGVLCIINDRVDVAVMSGADGVHVGQSDLPATEVRRMVGRGMIVGVSTHNLEQAKAAAADGADYIGVGPVFRSSTKPRDFLPGLEYARAAAENIRIPVVAIAGITLENVDEVCAAGIKRIAVASAVTDCDDVGGAARRLKEKLGVLPQMKTDGHR
jgi:thiamine-phosphate pyrophosphorylase